MKNKKNIIVVDPLNIGSSHVFFNVLFLRSLNEITKLVIAEETHIKNINKIIYVKNYVKVIEKNLILRIIKSITFVLKYSMFRSQRLLLLAFDNTIVPFLFLILYPLLFRIKLSLIIHNNLDTLTSSYAKKKLHLLFINLYKAQVIVLTEEMLSIYHDNISKRLNTVLVKHPNYKSIINTSESIHVKVESSNVKVAILGRQAKLLKETLYKIKLDRFKNIEFYIQDSTPTTVKKENIVIFSNRLTDESYHNLLAEIDFVIFANDIKVKNRASGILLDAVTFECPMIYSNIGHFKEYHDFKLGYDYSNESQLANILNKINNGKIKREEFTANFKKAIIYSNISQCDIINSIK